MRKIVTAAEMREIDRLTTERYATPSLLLMESAAGASAREIAARAGTLSGKRALVLCGRGNNGGDGAALARAMCNAGALVTLVLFGRVEETKGDARTNFEIARRLSGFVDGWPTPDHPLHFIECADPRVWDDTKWVLTGGQDIIVDALFGTGLTRPLEGVHARVVEHLGHVREARAHDPGRLPLFVSLDLPSGLDADSQAPVGPAARADLTVTFTAPKPANVIPPASLFGGELRVADIGSPRALIDEAPSKLFLAEAEDARAWLRKTRYAPGSYKNTHGHALVVAGSRDMTGAAVLCADACMRAGAGLVTLATPASALPSVAARLMPEVMTAGLAETESGAVSGEASAYLKKLLERADVLAVGCGLSRESESTRRFVREAVETRTTPVVVDADGLNALSPWPRELRGTREAPIVLTPHEGEMLRLLGSQDRSALGRRAHALAEFAAAHELIVVLKGTRTLVADPAGRVLVNPTGNAGLGTAGSGDTLTGIITGFLAQTYGTLKAGADAFEAVLAAVYVGGLAGDLAARERGMRATVAGNIREYLGAAFRELDPEGETP